MCICVLGHLTIYRGRKCSLTQFDSINAFLRIDPAFWIDEKNNPTLSKLLNCLSLQLTRSSIGNHRVYICL